MMNSIRPLMLALLRCAGCLLALLGSPAWAAYSCNVSATSTGVIYVAPTPVDANGTVTLTCSRSLSDAATLTYRIKANDGQNPSATAPFRRVELGATGNYLFYSLRRGSLGGAATCNNATNWRAPATGTTDVITGTLNFGAGATASAIWGYCIRVRVGAGGNPALPTAGAYNDTLGVFAQYPNNDAGVLSPSTDLMHTVIVGSHCAVSSLPKGTVFNYTSFQTVASTFNSSFALICSNTLPYTMALDFTSVTDSAVNLAYTLSLGAAGGTGNGTNQTYSVTGSMPPGQSGTCATAVCANASSGNKTRTITITY